MSRATLKMIWKYCYICYYYCYHHCHSDVMNSFYLSISPLGASNVHLQHLLTRELPYMKSSLNNSTSSFFILIFLSGCQQLLGVCDIVRFWGLIGMSLPTQAVLWWFFDKWKRGWFGRYRWNWLNVKWNCWCCILERGVIGFFFFSANPEKANKPLRHRLNSWRMGVSAWCSLHEILC